MIREDANVQDGSVLHAPPGIPCDIGPGGTHIPAEVLVTGAPAKVKDPIAGTGAQAWVNANPQAYRDLAQRYLDGLAEID